MKKITVILFVVFTFTTTDMFAQQPLYIVNGVEQDEIKNISPDIIEKTEMLPADEQTIAIYGEKANHGVMLITLRHDLPAIFQGDKSFEEYIADNVKWESDEPVARVIFRYTITKEGKTVITKELEATNSKLKRRVMQAVEQAPSWLPATKQGVPVESEGVLNIQLPEGKEMPKPIQLILR